MHACLCAHGVPEFSYDPELEMSTYARRWTSVAALLYLSLILSSTARGVRTFANGLGAWLERRRAARVALQELSAMSARELQDIGITRSDIERTVSQPPESRDRHSRH